ncbi:retrovirus-related pol polyprotein from transposon TNT 1-94 [Tanacetum coccineum]
MLKMVPETPLQFGVAERLSRTFRVESTGLCAEAPKMLWVDSISTAYLIYRIPYVPIGLRIPEEEWRGKDTSLAHLKAAAQMKCDTAFGIRRVTRLSEAKILHLWTRFIEPAKVGAQIREGSKNSRSFEDSGRSDEEYSEDEASCKEGGSETPQVRRSTRESRAPVRILARKKASQRLWMFKVKEEYNGRKSCEDYYNQSAGKEENLVYKLNKSLYGLKKAPRQWYLKFDSFMQRARYTKSSIHLVKNLNVFSWAKLVRILISEGSLSLLKILGTKSLAEMFQPDRVGKVGLSDSRTFASCIIGKEAYCSTGVEGRIAGTNPIPHR